MQSSLGVQERHLPKWRACCLPCLYSQLLFDMCLHLPQHQRGKLMPYKFNRPRVKDKKSIRRHQIVNKQIRSALSSSILTAYIQQLYTLACKKEQEKNRVKFALKLLHCFIKHISIDTHSKTTYHSNQAILKHILTFMTLYKSRFF